MEEEKKIRMEIEEERKKEAEQEALEAQKQP